MAPLGFHVAFEGKEKLRIRKLWGGEEYPTFKGRSGSIAHAKGCCSRGEEEENKGRGGKVCPDRWKRQLPGCGPHYTLKGKSVRWDGSR